MHANILQIYYLYSLECAVFLGMCSMIWAEPIIYHTISLIDHDPGQRTIYYIDVFISVLVLSFLLLFLNDYYQ